MSDATMTIKRVEQLLMLRDEYPMEEDCTSLEQIAASLENNMSAKEALAIVPDTEDCTLCEEAIALYLSINDADLFSTTPVVPMRRKPAPAIVIKFFVAAAAICVFGVVAVWWNAFSSEPDEHKSTLSAKGMTYDFQIAVSRGKTQFPLHPGKQVKTGDRLGFFYTAPAQGHLAVFFVDGTGEISALYPAHGEVTAFIKKGASVPLPDGAVVTPAHDREWIVAVFYKNERSIRTIQTDIKSSMDVGQGGALEVAPPGAMRTLIHQIRERGSE